ncbi:acyl-CoA thioesterase [Streptomyces bambusae]|uniref:acyl-CoA thioesterase n=1 Tax=Streptomyces bambusae TaxID=1550616 RepID=UPI001CFEDA07|nr:acyl-CoA thioesterase [Streptomyces bambusae]MCB5164580.1 acyl-CoA thioesterase [Streptomyces bambusae]
MTGEPAQDGLPADAGSDERAADGGCDRHVVTLRFLAEPSTVNFGGKVHGGALMKWIDAAGYACAAVWSRQYCVTVSVGNIQFRKPVTVGNLVEIEARIAATGRSSMHILVTVSAGDPRSDGLERTTDCVIVFVAVDADGHPVPVPPFTPRTPHEQRLARYATDLRQAHAQLDAIKP